MGRWKDRQIKYTYGPKITEYEITNEDEKGYPFTEMSYVFLDDIPKEYKEKFIEWMNANKLEITVEIKEEKKKNNVISYNEKKAVNVLYWEKWYSTYG